MCSNGTPEDRKRWAATYYAKNKQRYADLQREYLKTPIGKFKKLCAKAKQKALDVTLTFVEYCFLIESGTCAYCHKALGGTGYHVDRIDHKVGYSLFNCVPCCFSCNSKKGGLELAGFTYPRTIELLTELVSNG